ncbi:hypothetical protein ABZ912_20025 [Nonomuraea angiospora]|uniref:hypothetical protein n=1 Tax=Nonomuraea angiospora TaxID=46172 RepID=UPI0033F10581
MGYKRSKTVLLKWGADTDLSGLEVRARRISVEKFLELGPLLETDFDSFSPEDVEAMRGMFMEFGRVLVSWNLEDEDSGEPIPCTPETFLDQDIELVQQIVTAWAENIAGVSRPLPPPSPGGEPSPEALSLPMEVLSPSPPS